MTYPLIKPGVLEVYCGPMKSTKTKSIMDRVDKLRFVDGCEFIFFKPRVDTRDAKVKTRFGDLTYDCVFVDEKNPSEILDHVEHKHKMIIIEEVQFFKKGIEDIIGTLLLEDKNVMAGGLDLDFRGEPFGMMPYLLSMADEVHKLTAVCEYKLGRTRCGSLASRTQRLIDGEPAHYDSPLILIEGSGKEKYEPRCLKHHIVPGKPK